MPSIDVPLIRPIIQGNWVKGSKARLVQRHMIHAAGIILQIDSASMTEFRSDFLQTMSQRGYLHQCTDGQALDALAQQPGGITCYVGYDCTGPSLHVGHLLSIMMLRRLQQAGHKPIV